MIEVLMETVVAKLESQEKKLNQLQNSLSELSSFRDSVDAIYKALQIANAKINLISNHNKELSDLSFKLQAINENFVRLKERKRSRSHYLHKAILVSGTLFIIITTLAVLLLQERSKVKNLLEVDIKYRYLKVSGNQSVNKLLKQCDSLYIYDPRGMEESIIQKEQGLVEMTESLQQSEQKEIKAKQPKRKVGKKQNH